MKFLYFRVRFKVFIKEENDLTDLVVSLNEQVR